MKFYAKIYSLIVFIAATVYADVIEIQSPEQFQEIIQTNPLVITDFYAPWCQPCLRMAPHFHNVSVATPNVIFVKLSHSNEAVRNVLFKQYNVHSFPTLITFKNGQQKKIINGLQTLAQLRNIAARLIES